MTLTTIILFGLAITYPIDYGLIELPTEEVVIEETIENDSFYYPELQYTGVIYDGGLRYTWYSSNVLEHYMLSEFYTNDLGFWCYNGYLVVATQEFSKNSIVYTPWGYGIVLDYCETPKTIDMYVNW